MYGYKEQWIWIPIIILKREISFKTRWARCLLLLAKKVARKFKNENGELSLPDRFEKGGGENHVLSDGLIELFSMMID
jgi:hypothetical protein